EREVAAVGDQRPTTLLPDLRREPQLPELANAKPHGEGQYLDREPPAAAESRHELLRADQENLASRGGGDDALADQRAAETFEGVQVWIDLIRAVDGEVQRGLVKLHGSQSDLCRETGGDLRGGHARDRESPLGTPAERSNENSGRPARTETDCAPSLDKLEGPLGEKIQIVTDRCRGVGRLVVVDYLHWAATSRLAFNGIDPPESLLNEIWLGPERRAMGRGKKRHPARLRAAQSRRNWVFGRNLESRAPLRYAGPSGASTAYLGLSLALPLARDPTQ